MAALTEASLHQATENENGEIDMEHLRGLLDAGTDRLVALARLMRADVS